MHQKVGDIAMHEHFAGQQIDQFVGGDATVGASDPHVAGRLLRQQPGKETRLPGLNPGGPGAIALKQLGEIAFSQAWPRSL